MLYVWVQTIRSHSRHILNNFLCVWRKNRILHYAISTFSTVLTLNFAAQFLFTVCPSCCLFVCLALLICLLNRTQWTVCPCFFLFFNYCSFWLLIFPKFSQECQFLFSFNGTFFIRQVWKGNNKDLKDFHETMNITQV